MASMFAKQPARMQQPTTDVMFVRLQRWARANVIVKHAHSLPPLVILSSVQPAELPATAPNYFQLHRYHCLEIQY